MHVTNTIKVGASVPNEKAPGAINTEGLTTDTTNDLNFATGTQHGKALATLIAQLAIAGHAVHISQHGDFLVCKYNWARYCKDFDALQAFARQLGVTQCQHRILTQPRFWRRWPCCSRRTM